MTPQSESANIQSATIERGEALFCEEKYEEALAVFREILGSDPSSSAALNDAGVPYVISGMYAVYAYTGICRETKDLDLLLVPSAVVPAAEALKEAGFVWGGERLDNWLENPRTFLKGTKMSFAGLSKPEDRANVIAYMRAYGGGPEYPAPAAPETPEALDGAGDGPGGGVEGGAVDPVPAAGAMGDEQPVPESGAAMGSVGQ